MAVSAASTRIVVVAVSLPLLLLFIQFYDVNKLGILVPAMPEEPATDGSRTAYHEIWEMVNTTTTPLKEYTSPQAPTSCTALNSRKWMEGVRLGNVQVPNTNDMLNVEGPILSKLWPLLKQTVCHRQSPFLTLDTEDAATTTTEEDNLWTWAVRLIYLAVHYHQHHHALAEAKIRQQQPNCDTQLQQDHSIGNFDYECPEAKFFVLGLPPHGLGSIMRQNAHNALMAAIIENRTVLYMNHRTNGTVKTQNLYYDWIAASCDRFDYQCSFQPLSPCVITQDELDSAYVLSPPKINFEYLFRFAKEHKEDRVVVLDLKGAPKPVPDIGKKIFHRISNELIDQLDSKDPRIPLLRNASDIILHRDKLQEHAGVNANSIVAQGILMYNLRPNIQNLQKLNKREDPILRNDLDNSLTVGLPIRASDKCWKESECLNFPQYMRIVEQLWRKPGLADLYGSSKHVNILLTSDDKNMLEEQKRFMANDTSRQSLSFTPTFILNDQDVNQTIAWNRPIVSADEQLLNTLSSLKMQLSAKYSFGNCCSHFHNMIFDLLKGGCGITKHVYTECLQENENPEFQLCCFPRQQPRCVRQRDQRGQSTLLLPIRLAMPSQVCDF